MYGAAQATLIMQSELLTVVMLKPPHISQLLAVMDRFVIYIAA